MDSDVDNTGTSNQRYNCVCSENFSQPHIVSLATWYRHYQAASAEEREQMQHAKLDGIISSSDRRPRGTASRRHNGVLPVQKRAHELGKGQVSASPDKRGLQGEPEVPSVHFSPPHSPTAHGDAPLPQPDSPTLQGGSPLPLNSPAVWGESPLSQPDPPIALLDPLPHPDSPIPHLDFPVQGHHPLRTLINYR
ncbi:hypothetical protein OG21DRAFT_1489553 [Imleria badia]|nr:hypothetical protein OG21DRAFT_1489553 [Imleria badia]